MSIKLLQREEFDVSSETNDKFYEEVFQYTEYAPPKRRHGELYNVLQRLNIRPFSNHSIELYKYNKIGFYKQWMFVAATTMIAGCVSMITNWAAGSYLGVFCSLPIFIIGAVATYFLSGNREWIKVSLSSYKDYVPEFALQTAVDIKKNMPALYRLEISVEYLTVSKDPFLVVSLYLPGRYNCHEEYYVEVWNEPRFNQQKLV